VKNKIQNANYFETMKCKMAKFSWMCLIPLKMPNFSWNWLFFGLLRPKSKIENRYLFAKNFT
jgi:hypothetical protein